MIGLQSNKLNKERRLLMSAKTYSIESLLVGKNYRSRSRNFEGVITHAEKREGIWYGEGFDAYVVQIKTPTYLSDRYATVAVKIGE
jgi:hypothetical protein